MQKVLVVVDFQNDFIDGSLGTNEAQAIVSNVIEIVKTFDGKIIFTRDTHGDDYLSTLEGNKLPVIHCVEGTFGWDLRSELLELIESNEISCQEIIDKPSFGSLDLGISLVELNDAEPIESITFIGLCTDICVIANALLAKTCLPEVPIIVKASCCAGVTPESHDNALKAMAMCQIDIEE